MCGGGARRRRVHDMGQQVQQWQDSGIRGSSLHVPTLGARQGGQECAPAVVVALQPDMTPHVGCA
jgi:hypothetical protein